MPGLGDAIFSRSVVYVCDHSERGAMGIVINKPSDIMLQELFGKVDLPLGRSDLQEQIVFHGGPLHTDRGFVLHSPVRAIDAPDDTPIYASTMAVPGGLDVTTSRDVLEAIANGGGPTRVLVTLGYASWGEGQLESELMENSWLTVAADEAVIFDTPIADRYARALSLLGVDEVALSAIGGRA